MTHNFPESSANSPSQKELDAKFMQLAIDLSDENIDNGGGPFGAVIVKNNKIIATGVNRVTADNDPTAHAEVNAIRNACRNLQDFSLKGCTVYSSCEPCPMCLSALYWARVARIVFGNTKEDAKAIDFDDSFIYEQINLDISGRSLRCENLMRDEANKVFRRWAEKDDKVPY